MKIMQKYMSLNQKNKSDWPIPVCQKYGQPLLLYLHKYTDPFIFIDATPMTIFSITFRNASRACRQRQTCQRCSRGRLQLPITQLRRRAGEETSWNKHMVLTYPFDLLEVQECDVPGFLIAGDDILLPVHMEITG